MAGAHATTRDTSTPTDQVLPPESVYPMPELPEVEYVARQLRHALIGRTITAVQVQWPRAVANVDLSEFVARIAGQRVSGVGRRAKYLLLELSGGDVLVVHRRMTGNLILARPD